MKSKEINKNSQQISLSTEVTQNFSDLCTGLHSSLPDLTSAAYSSKVLAWINKITNTIGCGIIAKSAELSYLH